MGVVSGSGWNLWVWLRVSSRCGCKEVYIFIPTPLVSALFCSSIPTFCSFLKYFSFFEYIFE